MTLPITIVILTFNEAIHIKRCIDSVSSLPAKVVVVDSFSSDKTVSIAKSLGATVYQNEFINQAQQLNWMLDNCHIDSDWIFRLDADEIVSQELASSIKSAVSQISTDVSGFTVNRQIHFLGKWIKYGGIYPISPLRIWKNGSGRCETRLMDEHMIVSGNVKHLNGDIIDDNLNSLTWWISKHNNYASREAIESLVSKNTEREVSGNTPTDVQAKYKRWVKEYVYAKLPLGLRAIVYFLFRYFLRLGFLDGRKGLAFHFLQGLWYRFLVDLKMAELEQLMHDRKHTLEQVVLAEYGYLLDDKK